MQEGRCQEIGPRSFFPSATPPSPRPARAEACSPGREPGVRTPPIPPNPEGVTEGPGAPAPRRAGALKYANAFRLHQLQPQGRGVEGPPPEAPGRPGEPESARRLVRSPDPRLGRLAPADRGGHRASHRGGPPSLGRLPDLQV